MHSSLHEDGTFIRQFPSRDFFEIMQPRLYELAPLLDAMHYYLCRIPWAPLESFYRDTGRVFPLHPAHAFIAPRKSIVRFVAKCDASMLDVPLRTDRPRPVPLDRFGTSRTSMQAHCHTSQTGSNHKRKAEDWDGTRPSKRQASMEKDVTGVAEWRAPRDDVPLTPGGVFARSSAYLLSMTVIRRLAYRAYLFDKTYQPSSRVLYSFLRFMYSGQRFSPAVRVS